MIPGFSFGSRFLGLGLSFPELRVLEDNKQPPVTIDPRITIAGEIRITQAGAIRVVDET